MDVKLAVINIKLAIVAAAFLTIARAHVTLTPGWTVPLPALLLAAALALFAGVAWFAASRHSRPSHPVSYAPRAVLVRAGGGGFAAEPGDLDDTDVW